MKRARILPGFSQAIDIHVLERETRRMLRTGFFAGALMLVVLGLLWHRREVVRTAKVDIVAIRPLKTHFIELPPRDRAFLSVRPHPFVKRVLRPYAGRPGFSSSAPSGDVTVKKPGIAERAFETLPDSSAPPDVRVDTDSRDFLSSGHDLFDEPGRIDPRDFSMNEELLTIDNLASDEEIRYRGIVLLKPGDPLTIRGVVPVPLIYGSSYPNLPLSEGMDGLSKAVRMFTDLELVYPRRPLHLGMNLPMRYPFVYIACGETWEYLPVEAKNMGAYLKSGGFAVFENLTPWMEQSPAEASLRQFIVDALGPSAQLKPIPNDHPLYHCFFDFPDGPPRGAEEQNLGGLGGGLRRKPVLYLEGVWLGQRLVAIFSNKGYGAIWRDDANSEPQRKMGVNMLVFSLLQVGGKIEKHYDRSLQPGVVVQRWMSGEIQPFSGVGNGGSGNGQTAGGSSGRRSNGGGGGRGSR